MYEKAAEEYVIKKYNIDMLKQSVDFSLKCEFADDLTDFQKGAEFGYNKANEWHCVKDKLPPNPKESEDGFSNQPLCYICAYDMGDGDYECDEFMYLGNGVWNGENEKYPIYAWLEHPVEVPKPRKGDCINGNGRFKKAGFF